MEILLSADDEKENQQPSIVVPMDDLDRAGEDPEVMDLGRFIRNQCCRNPRSNES